MKKTKKRTHEHKHRSSKKNRKSHKKSARKVRRDSSTSSSVSSGSTTSSSSSTSGTPPKAGANIIRDCNYTRSKCLKVDTRNHIEFIGDSGATDHFVNSLSGLTNVEKLATPKMVSCANKNEIANIIVTHLSLIHISEPTRPY